MLLVRYGNCDLAFAEGWEEEYRIKRVEKNPRVRGRADSRDIVEEDEEDSIIVSEAVSTPVKRQTCGQGNVC